MSELERRIEGMDTLELKDLHAELSNRARDPAVSVWARKKAADDAMEIMHLIVADAPVPDDDDLVEQLRKNGSHGAAENVQREIDSRSVREDIAYLEGQLATNEYLHAEARERDEALLEAEKEKLNVLPSHMIASNKRSTLMKDSRSMLHRAAGLKMSNSHEDREKGIALEAEAQQMHKDAMAVPQGDAAALAAERGEL